jgi:long-subunit fatty acid transport protein
MRKSLALVIIILFWSVKPVLAKVGEAGAAGTYLRMGAGARALAIGGAHVAISDDVYATYWNPAGLTQLNSFQIGSMYAIMSCDRRYSFLNYAQRLRKSWAVGASWIGFRIDNIEARDAAGKLTGKLKDSENSLYFSLARRIIPTISLGANLKYLSHQLASKSAKGCGFDIGVLFKPKSTNLNLSLGLTLQDIISHLKWDTESKHKDKFPLNIRLGGALKLFKDKLLLACDLEKNESQAMKLHTGAEYWVIKSFAIRVGYDDKELTAGAGFKLHNFQLDYGFGMDKLKVGATHRLSILFSFY